MKYLAVLFLLSSLPAFTQTSKEEQKYNELLKRHALKGHLNEKEIKEQSFKYSNTKTWQGKFKKQVRGVASTMDKSRDILEFKNPPIEISVK